MRLAALLALAATATAQHNALTPQEKSDGWILLFDGKTYRHWQDPAKKHVPGDGWVILDGCLKTVPHARITEDLLTTDSWDDFDLKFEWKVSAGANTGLKYRLQHILFIDEQKLQPGPNGFEGLLGREIESPKSDRAHIAPNSRGQEYTIGFEMQLIDDQRHPDALRGADRQTGSLYSMIARTQAAAHPAGEWNNARLVVRGQHVEHWVNDVKVLDALLDDPRVKEGVAKRWGPAPAIRMLLSRPMTDGPIGLQHHGDEVWFRDIRIRRIPRED